MLGIFEPIHSRFGIGTGKFLAWIIGKGVAPHITVRDQSLRDDGTFSRSDFRFDKERNHRPLTVFNLIFVAPSTTKRRLALRHSFNRMSA